MIEVAVVGGGPAGAYFTPEEQQVMLEEGYAFDRRMVHLKYDRLVGEIERARNIAPQSDPATGWISCEADPGEKKEAARKGLNPSVLKSEDHSRTLTRSRCDLAALLPQVRRAGRQVLDHRAALRLHLRLHHGIGRVAVDYGCPGSIQVA